MGLVPAIAATVAHLFDATWAQVLTREVAGARVTDPVDGPYVDRHADCPPPLWPGREGITGLFAAYLGHDAAGAPDDVVPARRDVAPLPWTLVTTAEVDALRAQADAFVRRLEDTGVDVSHHHVGGVLHGYLNTVGDEPLATAALDRHVAWLRGRLVP